MLLREYPGLVNWPLPGGAFAGSEPLQFDDSKVIVLEVFPVVNQFVTFTGREIERPNSHPDTYDLEMEDEEIAKQVAFWLQQLIGKTLDRFAEFPLDQ